jgi:serine protease Do
MPRVDTPFRNRVHFLALVAALILFVPHLRADQSKDPPKDPKDTKAPLVVPEAFAKTAPESVDDLRAMEAHTRALVQKVMPTVVCVRVGNASGSGVIVSEDGLILTAAHVVGKPDQDVEIILSDGKTKLKGKTLGMHTSIDSGMMKITEKITENGKEKKWPFAEMGESAKLKKGQWVLTMGHPGGFQQGRTPPVRLGRILEASPKVIRTDCTVFSGDSGGPLFDMEGKVVGIHSRIASSLTINWHVPIDTFRETWDRLVKGEKWGGTIASEDPPDEPKKANAWLGVQSDIDKEECRITSIVPKSPAEKAGFKNGDLIVKFGSKKVESFDDLVVLLRRQQPGDKVDVQVMRDGAPLTLNVTLGEKSNSDK